MMERIERVACITFYLGCILWTIRNGAWVAMACLFFFREQEKPCDGPLKELFWIISINRVAGLAILFHLSCSLNPKNWAYILACTHYCFDTLVIMFTSTVVYRIDTTCDETMPLVFDSTRLFVTASLASTGLMILGVMAITALSWETTTKETNRPAPIGCIDELKVIPFENLIHHYAAAAAASGDTVTGVSCSKNENGNDSNSSSSSSSSSAREIMQVEQDLDMTECCICKDEFSSQEPIVETPCCKHLFHKSCCGEWLERASTCPFCRTDIAANLKQHKEKGIIDNDSPHYDEEYELPRSRSIISVGVDYSNSSNNNNQNSSSSSSSSRQHGNSERVVELRQHDTILTPPNEEDTAEEEEEEEEDTETIAPLDLSVTSGSNNNDDDDDDDDDVEEQQEQHQRREEFSRNDNNMDMHNSSTLAPSSTPVTHAGPETEEEPIIICANETSIESTVDIIEPAVQQPKHHNSSFAPENDIEMQTLQQGQEQNDDNFPNKDDDHDTTTTDDDVFQEKEQHDDDQVVFMRHNKERNKPDDIDNDVELQLQQKTDNGCFNDTSMDGVLHQEEA